MYPSQEFAYDDSRNKANFYGCRNFTCSAIFSCSICSYTCAASESTASGLAIPPGDFGGHKSKSQISVTACLKLLNINEMGVCE